MKRVIYSIFIQIPDEELDWQPPHPGETESKNDKANRVFRENHEWLTDMQNSYAKKLNVEYRQYLRDEKYEKFEKEYKKKYPYLTTWNIVNFYKIHLMYELANEFDEVLYLDIDVVPITDLNFFEEHDLSQGLAIFQNNPGVDTSLYSIRSNTKWREENDASVHSVRSPAAKYWNSYALLEYEGEDPRNFVFNTGIVGATKEHLTKLGYFDDFDNMLETMTELVEDEESMYPQWIQEMFGWDNETVWSYYHKINDPNILWLNQNWHWFMNDKCFVPEGTKLIHVINKEFEWVRNWCDEHNIHPISSAD